MNLPPIFEEKLDSGKVCGLKKSLYGLKQSPGAWFEPLGKVVQGHGCCQSLSDHTKFYKHSREGKIAILIIYVDNIILIGSDEIELKNFKKNLAHDFEMRSRTWSIEVFPRNGIC